MDIKKCFEILELKGEVSPDQARQAYRDLVAIWHPDRFSGNPRLKQRAEEKLKEINKAYEEVRTYFSGVEARAPGSKYGPDSDRRGKERDKAPDHEARGRTEEVAEAGTRMVLYAWYYLSRALRRLSSRVEEPSAASGEDGVDASNREKGRKRGGRSNEAGGVS